MWRCIEVEESPATIFWRGIELDAREYQNDVLPPRAPAPTMTTTPSARGSSPLFSPPPRSSSTTARSRTWRERGALARSRRRARPSEIARWWARGVTGPTTATTRSSPSRASAKTSPTRSRHTPRRACARATTGRARYGEPGRLASPGTRVGVCEYRRVRARMVLLERGTCGTRTRMLLLASSGGSGRSLPPPRVARHEDREVARPRADGSELALPARPRAARTVDRAREPRGWRAPACGPVRTRARW